MSKERRELLEKTYDRFGKDLYSYLAVLTGSRDRAEDLMQEAFLRLLRVARRDAQALQNRSYVLRVARNEAYRALASDRRRAALQSDRLLEIRDPTEGSESERLAIEEALARLPHEQREVVHLKVYMRMTFDEIAGVTGVSQNTAASRYRYAIDKLRGLLGHEEQRT